MYWTLVLSLLVTCYAHKQIRLSLGETPDQMTIMWITKDSVDKPQVQYGLSPSSLSSTTVAQNTSSYSVNSYTSGDIHTAVLSGLLPNKQYYYRVGDAGGDWTNVHTFSTDRRYPVNFLATADFGTLPYCKGCGDVLADMLDYHSKFPADFVMHAGDISYANGKHPIWDEFGDQMQPLTENVPYMVAAGNHENHDNWIAFTSRFDMHADDVHTAGGNFFYSFDFGPVHFIILDSEADSFDSQIKWLLEDLPAINRTATPWVFGAWHRPWYCSNKAHPGSGDAMKAAFEDLLYKYKVDAMFVGHTHVYERTQPMYKGKIVPDGIVTLLNGNGGDHEGSKKKWIDPQPDWSVYRTLNYGFGSATVYNSTHMHWQMHEVDSGSVVDDWWFIRDH